MRSFLVRVFRTVEGHDEFHFFNTYEEARDFFDNKMDWEHIYDADIKDLELEAEYRAMHAAEADRRAEREYRDLLERWDREEATLKAGKQLW